MSCNGWLLLSPAWRASLAAACTHPLPLNGPVPIVLSISQSTCASFQNGLNASEQTDCAWKDVTRSAVSVEVATQVVVLDLVGSQPGTAGGGPYKGEMPVMGLN